MDTSGSGWTVVSLITSSRLAETTKRRRSSTNARKVIESPNTSPYDPVPGVGAR
jgi:hypothetical protein